MTDTHLILIAALIVALVVILDDGAAERWCATYPEWCEQENDS